VLTFRNTLKRHIVTVSEPADILAAAEQEAERLLRLGTKEGRLNAERVTGKAQAVARQMRQTLKKMDESRRWERYTAPPVVVTPPPVVEAAPAIEPVPVETSAPAKAVKATAKSAKEPEPEQVA